MDKLDYKRVYKEFYQPPMKPAIVQVPEMRFIVVDGKGDPNECVAYKEALEILYGLSFSIKMSKMNGSQPAGYFEYVVPPLEGLWYVDNIAFDGTNVADKDLFCWRSMIRQPEFVDESVFEAARAVLQKKKPDLNLDKAKLLNYTEGLCVQIMHKGSYDDEPASIEKMRQFASENGFVEDFKNDRLHHEIYLSDPRRCAPKNLKTVIRHPIRKDINNERTKNGY